MRSNKSSKILKMTSLTRKNSKQSLGLKIIFKRIAVILTIFFCLVVIFQDLLIFPGVIRSKFLNAETSPTEVVEHLLDTNDGRKISLWELPVPQFSTEKKKIALIFHGNGGDVSNFYQFQEWFKNQGYTSYDFDYPGFGKSTGWMSEKKIYQDSETVLRFISKTENISENDIVIFGISIGSGAAAYIAQLFQSKTVIINSGYSSIPEVVKTRLLIGILWPFLRYNFPTANYLEKLNQSCIVVAHGKKDEVIPYDNALRLKAAAEQSNSLHLISSELGRHNDTFWEKNLEIQMAIAACSK